MKAVIIEGFGGAEELKLTDRPVPEPDNDEVLIELACTSVNPVDWKIREGRLKERLPHAFPLIPGWDAAGTVHSLGSGVSSLQPGDKVYAYCRKPVVQHGTYAEYVTMEASAIAPMPANLSMAQAAAIPLTALTAWQALFEFAELKSGATVLIHAGGGGVGGMAIQFARHAGATVYTTASARNHDYVRELGAHVPIDYENEDFVDVVEDDEPEGIDVVLDTLGGDIQSQSFELLKPGGVLVSISKPPDEAVAKQHKVKAGWIFVRPDGQQLREIGRLLEAGAVKPPYIEEMKLEDAETAQRRSQAGHVRGKIVLRIKD